MNTLFEAFGWTLLHFLWQSALIAVILWGALQAPRSAPAPGRYALSGSALLSMVSAASISEVSQWQDAAHSAASPFLFWIAALWAAGVSVLTFGFLRSCVHSGSKPSDDETVTAKSAPLWGKWRWKNTVALSTTTAATVAMVRLRKESKHCCDATAAGDPLPGRIRRLLSFGTRPSIAAFPWPAGLAVALLALSLLGGARFAHARPERKAIIVRGILLDGLPQSDNITEFADLYEPNPDDPGDVRQKPAVFFMSLQRNAGDVGPWLYYPANADHFYLSVRPDPEIVKDINYGPLDGNPVEKLDLAEWLRDSPNHSDPGYARRVTRDMLACGDPSLGRLALDWLGEFKPPSPPDANEGFIEALEKHLKAQPASSFAERAREVLAHLMSMKEIAKADWETKRETLPEEEYAPGKPLAEAEAGIVWGETQVNGLRLGVSDVSANGEYPIGSTLGFDAFVRNDGEEPVKFAWTGRVDEGLRAILEREGKRTEASITPIDNLLIHMRCRLDPGSVLQVNYGAEFRILQAKEEGTSPEPDFHGNQFRIQEPGTYTLEVVCSLGVPDWTDSDGKEYPHPAGEWTGTLHSKPVEISVTAEPDDAGASYLNRPLREWDEMLEGGSIDTNDREAVKALGHGFGGDAIPVPADALPLLFALLKSGQPATKCRCMGLLRKIENPGSEVFDALLASLADPVNRSARMRAAYFLADYPNHTDYIVPRLIALIKGSAPHFHESAAFSLGRIGPAAKDALPAMEELRVGAADMLLKVLDEAITGIRATPVNANDAPRPDGLVLFVVDAKTHEPIKHFRVIAGVPSGVSTAFEEAKGVTVSNWQSHTLREGKDGEFTWPADKGYAEMALRVEADGYVPQVIDGIKKGAKDILHLAMQPDPGHRGSVQTPGNKRPAHDATVVLAMIRKNAQLAGTGFPELQLNEGKTPRDLWDRPHVVTPDDNGGFTLPTEIDPTAVVLIVHGDGVYEKPYAEWRMSPDVTLEPWGRIHGKVQWSDKVGTGERVDLIINRGDEYGYPDIVAHYDNTTAIEDGIFVFERVLPGLAQLSCPIEVVDEAGETLTIYGEGRVTHAEISAPHTAVLLGGVGRTVTGKLLGRDGWEGVTFHLHPTAPHIGLPGDDAMWEAWNALKDGPLGPHFFRDGLKVAPNGSFVIPRVLPGSYQIFFSRDGEDKHLASDQLRIPEEVPYKAPEPIDIGEIRAQPE